MNLLGDDEYKGRECTVMMLFWIGNGRKEGKGE